MSADRELPPGRLSDLRLAWAGSMRRARLRREIEIIRYRLAIRIGGWLVREEQAENRQLREIAATNGALYRSAEGDVSAVHALLAAQGRMLDDWAEANEERRRELWQRLHEEADRVRGVLNDAHSPAEPVSPVSTPTEAHGETGEAQEGSGG